MIDVEKLAREAGLIEPSDVWFDLPAEYRQAITLSFALVLEKAAEEMEPLTHLYADEGGCANTARNLVIKLAQELRA